MTIVSNSQNEAGLALRRSRNVAIPEGTIDNVRVQTSDWNSGDHSTILIRADASIQRVFFADGKYFGTHFFQCGEPHVEGEQDRWDFAKVLHFYAKDPFVTPGFNIATARQMGTVQVENSFGSFFSRRFGHAYFRVSLKYVHWVGEALQPVKANVIELNADLAYQVIASRHGQANCAWSRR